MNAIQLHSLEEEIIGTVVTENNANYNRICDMWDDYVSKYNGNEDIYQFEELYSNDIFLVLPIDFYQPETL